MLAAAAAGLEVAEYSPLSIKSAVVGYGRAEKQQVKLMVQALLARRADDTDLPGTDTTVRSSVPDLLLLARSLLASKGQPTTLVAGGGRIRIGGQKSNGTRRLAPVAQPPKGGRASATSRSLKASRLISLRSSLPCRRGETPRCWLSFSPTTSA